MKGGIKMKRFLSLAMGVVLSVAMFLGSSDYAFAAENSPEMEANASDVSEGELKTVVIDMEDVLSGDVTILATSSSKTKTLSKDHATSQSQSGNPKCQGIGELTLLDFLEAAEGKNSNLAEKKFTLAGGGTLVCPILTSGGHGADIYYQGTKVLTYLGSGYGWAYERTPAEREKEREFYGIYFNEYRTLKNEQGSELEELPDYLEEKPSFDMKA